MGNCTGKSSSVWAGEDWGSVGPKNHHDCSDDENQEKEQLLDPSSSSNKEVKITISKKELEEIMKKVNMQGLCLEEILAKMVRENGGNAAELMEDEHHHHWKPALQSIPEVD